VSYYPDGPRRAVLFDASAPNVARMYDYWLGGKDNYEADREAADRITALIPEAPAVCCQNRAFLERVVRFLVADAGIRQIIDIGSGLPTMSNTHQIAQAAAPGTRVMYADNDLVVVNHAAALLADEETVIAVDGDIRLPMGILANPRVTKFLDFSEPVAVLMLAILHFIPDEDDPWRVAGEFRDAMPAGSYLAVSHVTDIAVTAHAREGAREIYAGSNAPVTPRSLAQVQRFFGGFTLIDPYITDVSGWRAARPFTAYSRPLLLGGAGRKP
jgi:S-adenosyl methyltransferase